MKKVDIFKIVDSMSKDVKQYLQHDRHLAKICSLFINTELWNDLSDSESITFEKHIVPVIQQNKELDVKLQRLLPAEKSLSPLMNYTDIIPTSSKDLSETNNLSLTSVLFFAMLLQEYENKDLQEVIHSESSEMIEYIDLADTSMETLNKVLDHYNDEKKREIEGYYLSEKDQVRKMKNTVIRNKELEKVNTYRDQQLALLDKSVKEVFSDSLNLLSILQRLEVVLARNLNSKYSILIEKLTTSTQKFSALPMNYKSIIYRKHRTYLEKYVNTIEEICMEIESQKNSSEAIHAKFLFNLELNSGLPKDFNLNIPKKKPKQD